MNYRNWFSKERITNNDDFCFKSPITRPDHFRLVLTPGEQVIDQSEKDAVPSIFDYPFHLVKTMNTLILSCQRFYSNFVLAKEIHPRGQS